MAELGDEPASGTQECQGRRRERRVGLVPRRTRRQRRPRLVVANLGLERLPLGRGDVGGVRDDEIAATAPRTRRIGEVPQPELHAGDDAVALGVRARDGERPFRKIEGQNARVRTLERDRHRDAAAPRAEIGHDRGVGKLLEGGVDDELGLGPRDEDPRVDVEAAAAKLGEPLDVLERLPRLATRDRPLEPRGVLRAQGIGAPREQGRPVAAEDGGDEELRLAGRQGNAGALEPAFRLGERLPDGPQARTSSFSRSAWSCATRASITSPISPAIRLGRSWTVRPIR